MRSRPVCQALSPESIVMPWLTNQARMVFLVLLMRPSSVLRYLTSDRNSRCSGEGMWTGLSSPMAAMPSQFEGVVFVGLAFDVGPPPGFFVGRADEVFEFVFERQIVDPSRGSASLHDDEVGVTVFEDRLRCVARVVGTVANVCFSSFRVETSSRRS